MGQRLVHFLDTPVLLDRLGNRSRASEPDAVRIITGILNVYEVVHVLLRQGKVRGAEIAYQWLAAASQGLTRNRIFEASRLRVRLQDRGLSYADAAGYVTARELGAVFLTTDRGFTGLPGTKVVES